MPFTLFPPHFRSSGSIALGSSPSALSTPFPPVTPFRREEDVSEG